MPHPPLTDTQRLILDMESSWYRYEGAKDALIRERLGISSTRYHQIVGALIDNPAAMEQSPATVRRLRSLRDRRRGVRSA